MLLKGSTGWLGDSIVKNDLSLAGEARQDDLDSRRAGGRNEKHRDNVRNLKR